MKRYLGCTLAILTAASLAACGNASGGNETATTVAASNGGAAADVSATVEPERVIQLGHIDPSSNDPYQLLAELFAEKTAELSGGKIQIDILSDAQLGGETSMIEGMKDSFRP